MPLCTRGFAVTARRSELSGRGGELLPQAVSTDSQARWKKAGSRGLHDWPSMLSIPKPPVEKRFEFLPPSPPQGKASGCRWSAQRASPGHLGLWLDEHPHCEQVELEWQHFQGQVAWLPRTSSQGSQWGDHR